jgi:hypothetical protein
MAKQTLAEGINQIKAHGNRTILMKGKEAGDLVGHVDVIPRVDVTTMADKGEGHHAYAVSKRKGKHGISHYVTRRLGEFNTHDEAVAAVKKFHKIEEGVSVPTKKSEGDIITEAIDTHLQEQIGDSKITKLNRIMQKTMRNSMKNMLKGGRAKEAGNEEEFDKQFKKFKHNLSRYASVRPHQDAEEKAQDQIEKAKRAASQYGGLSEAAESEHEPFPSKDFKKVKLGTKGKHTLSHVTRLKDNHSFYHLSDDWRSDYPVHYSHTDRVGFDNPEFFPKKVVSWASDLVKKHAKGTVSEGTESLIEENYKARLKKLGFSEQIPAQTKDGLSGVYRFDHPDYEIEARPKADPGKDFKYTIKDKRTGRRHVSQHLTRVEKFLTDKGALKEAWYGNSSFLSHPSYTTGKSIGTADPGSASGLRDKLYSVHQRHSEIADSLGREMDKLDGAKPGTPEYTRYHELGDKRSRHARLSNRAYAAFRGISTGQRAKK